MDEFEFEDRPAKKSNNPSQFATNLIAKEPLRAMMKRLAAAIVERARKPAPPQAIGLLTLGTAGAHAARALYRSAAFESVEYLWRDVGPGPTAAVAEDWCRAMTALLPWEELKTTSIVLYAQEVRTGESMDVLRDVVCATLGRPPESVTTACLIQRVCHGSPEPDVVGYQVWDRPDVPGGVVFGAGLDLRERHRDHETLWYTIAPPGRVPTKPSPDQMPYIVPRLGPSQYPIDWCDDK